MDAICDCNAMIPGSTVAVAVVEDVAVAEAAAAGTDSAAAGNSSWRPFSISALTVSSPSVDFAIVLAKGALGLSAE